MDSLTRSKTLYFHVYPERQSQVFVRQHRIKLCLPRAAGDSRQIRHRRKTSGYKLLNLHGSIPRSAGHCPSSLYPACQHLYLMGIGQGTVFNLYPCPVGCARYVRSNDR